MDELTTARRRDRGRTDRVDGSRAHARETSGSPTQPVAAGAESASLRLLRFPAIRDLTGLSRSTIWRLERTAAFPPHVRLSANTVAWVEGEVRNWIRQKLT
jgi:prophage regulatory protein